MNYFLEKLLKDKCLIKKKSNKRCHDCRTGIITSITSISGIITKWVEGIFPICQSFYLTHLLQWMSHSYLNIT